MEVARKTKSMAGSASSASKSTPAQIAAAIAIEEVLSLLRAKNRCLERILGICAVFLGRWETLNEEARSQELARLQEKRESYFRILELYDQKVTETLKAHQHEKPQAVEIQKALEHALSERSRLVSGIMGYDNKIMAMLEAEKNRIVDELAGTRKNQTLVNKFKSSWVPESGEGLDRKL